jgi:large subunit ribosomal protein L23
MNKERLYEVIRHPVVSEKSTTVGEFYNQIVLEVDRSATKPEIKEVVEKLFKVRVLSVQVLNRKGKQKRFGQTMGRKSDRRRAYVRLHADDDIDFTQTLDS